MYQSETFGTHTPISPDGSSSGTAYVQRITGQEFLPLPCYICKISLINKLLPLPVPLQRVPE